MKYAIVIKQEGEGCDYTIGCGMRFVELNATSIEEARNEMESYISETGLLIGEDGGRIWKKLNWIKLIQVLEEAPIEIWFKESLENMQKTEEQRIEAKERALYEYLSKKFAKS